MRQCRFIRWFLLCALAFSSTTVYGAPQARHVIHVSVDGLSSAFFEMCLTNTPERYPIFRRLMREGAFTLNARCDYDFSETTPNHATMITGRPVLRPEGWADTSFHGYVNNYETDDQTLHVDGNPAAGYLSSVFDVVHDHGLSTAFLAGKDKLKICFVSYDEENGAVDEIDEDNGRNKVDYAEILDFVMGYNCTNITDSVTNLLAYAAPHYLFIHIADLDYTGHYTGWGSPAWCTRLALIDECLGHLLEAVELHPDMSGRTTFIVTTDHGGGYPLYTHVYPQYRLNYTIPIMIWGPGWPAGGDLYRMFANRFDPGAVRLDYNAPLQPLRNGDAANLALAILGLPVIPGSSILPRLGVPAIALEAGASEDGLTIAWPGPAVGFVLESSEGFSTAYDWLEVGEVTAVSDTLNAYFVPAPVGGPPKYFRLRMK